MSPSAATTRLLETIAETVVIAAWLAVPLFALLAAGGYGPPLHAAAVAALLTLALRGWRAARRGRPLRETRRTLAFYLLTHPCPPPTPRRPAVRPLLKQETAVPLR